MRLTGIALALITACVASRPGGAFRISATHYQSMTAVKMGTGADAMTCSRDIVTGSHILRWYCKYEENGPQYQLEAPIRFDMRAR
jgi:hypothetical protein